ncbi:MAG: hypothetical protein ABEI98_08220 [Halorhabdus sp.]
MGRRKITEEAESKKSQSEQTDTDDGESERTQLTQRMPDDLLDDVDDLADEMGMSRNAAINLLVKQGLKGF